MNKKKFDAPNMHAHVALLFVKQSDNSQSVTCPVCYHSCHMFSHGGVI